MTIYTVQENLTGACGVRHISEYRYRDWEGNHWYYKSLRQIKPGGIGLISAGFIDTSICKQVYEALSEKYNVVYQSPVRYNRNSGNQFFFCIFEDKKVKA